MTDIGPQIEATVADNPVVADMLEDLIVEALFQLKRDLKIGDSKQRSEAMKLIVGHAMKAREQRTSDRMDGITAEMRELMRESMEGKG